MTIIRGPEPRENFQILPNATARDRRLSFRARGLLVMMLSYPPDWRFDRDWLARQTDGEGSTAVRAALQELEKVGYLVRRRTRVKGQFTWDFILYRTPPETAGHSIGGKPADGIPADGFPPSSEELGHEELPEDALLCPSSSVAGGAQNFEPTWRDEDRELFRSLVGDKLRSEGVQWGKGIWTADVFYDAYRKVRKHRWPGRYVQKIDDDMGLADWLISEGLEQL